MSSPVDVDYTNAFKIIYNDSYDPLSSKCYGWNIYNELRVWTLKVDNGKLYLSNDMNVSNTICEFTKAPKRVSLAFLNFNLPIFVIQYEDDSSVIFSYDLNTKVLTTLLTEVNHRDISVIYDRRTNQDKLLTYSVLGSNVYSGLLDTSGWSALTQIKTYDPALLVNIQRVGQTLTNQVRMEISTFKTENS